MTRFDSWLFYFFAALSLTAGEIDITPTGRGVEILAPGEEFVWTVKVPSHAANRSVFWQISGWHGEPITAPTALALNQKEATLHYKPTKVGWQELVLTLRDQNGKIVAEKRRGFVSGETRKLNPDDFKYGVCAHLLRNEGERYAADLEVADKLGVAYLRDDLSWSRVQPRSGEWNWERVDGMVADLEKRGIQLDAILCYTAAWASTQPDSAHPTRVLPQLEPWLEYVRQSVLRYQGRIHYWEIWNEPDIGSFWQGSTDDYVKLFAATARVIKEASPKASVINGGFALRSRQPNPDFLGHFLSKADRTYWDLFAFHDYHTFHDLLGHHRQITALRAQHEITIPLWMNEGGLDSAGEKSEYFQAITLVKKLATAQALGLKAYFVYDLRNDGTNPDDGEHNFGLVWNDHSAKPSFGAYQTLIRQLGGRPFRFTSTLSSPEVWVQRYGGRSPDDSNMAVMWSESPGAVLVWIDPLKDAQAFDLMGNPLPLAASTNGKLVKLDAEPIYLVTPKDSAWSLKPVVNVPASIKLTPGNRSGITLQVTNPLKQPALLTIETINLPAGIRPVKLAPIELKPEESRPVALEIACDAAMDSNPAIQLRVTLNQCVAEMMLPTHITQTLPRINKQPDQFELASDEGKTIRLQEFTAIVNLFSAEPNDAMHWHGADDLSAVARLAYDDTAIYLTIDVADDVHAQKYRGEQLWKGDSLQLKIQSAPGKKNCLDLALARRDSSQTDGWIYQAPERSSLSIGAIKSKEIPHLVRVEKGRAVYALKVPWKVLGLSSPPEAGFQLSFQINDNDGSERKQWVQLSDGIGRSTNATILPWFICLP